MTDEQVSSTFSGCNSTYMCLSPVLQSFRAFWNALGWKHHGLPLSLLWVLQCKARLGQLQLNWISWRAWDTATPQSHQHGGNPTLLLGFRAQGLALLDNSLGKASSHTCTSERMQTEKPDTDGTLSLLTRRMCLGSSHSKPEPGTLSTAGQGLGHQGKNPIINFNPWVCTQRLTKVQREIQSPHFYSKFL